MRERVLITRLWPEAVLAQIAERYEMTVDRTDRPLGGEAMSRAMAEFDVICPTISDKIHAGMLARRDRRVRLIANYGAGFEHIDLAAARAAGVIVTNTPDVLTQATAELCILLMLMAARRAGEGERQLRAGAWPGWHPVHLMGQSLHGRELGLVGFGRIAQATARMARDLWNMRISYHARRPAELPPELLGADYCAELDTLLGRADVVSLHCPGGPATRHLIDAAALRRMKSEALLINTARGTVVDEAALAEALSKGEIAAAGLDVYEHEPRVHPSLLSLENVVLLPHLGSATIETRTAMGLRVLANVDAFLAGREPPDRVA